MIATASFGELEILAKQSLHMRPNEFEYAVVFLGVGIECGLPKCRTVLSNRPEPKSMHHFVQVNGEEIVSSWGRRIYFIRIRRWVEAEGKTTVRQCAIGIW